MAVGGYGTPVASRSVRRDPGAAAPRPRVSRAGKMLEAWIVVAVGVICATAAAGVALGYAPAAPSSFARAIGVRAASVRDVVRERPAVAGYGRTPTTQSTPAGPRRNASVGDWLQTKNNLTKMAWAASDTDAAKTFLLRYASSMAALDGCDPSCECGSQGRVMLNGSSGFGLHSVDAWTRPTGAGLNVSALERVFAAKIGSMGSYVDVMDHHVALWAPDLDAIVSRLRLHAQPYYAMAWPGVDGATYYSVLVHHAGSQILIELVGASSTLLDPAEVVATSAPRYGGSLAAYVAMPCCDMEPLWVSRATSDADRDWDWYASKLNANLTFSADAPGGVKYRYGTLASSSAWEVHFVERPPDANGGLTVAQIEADLVATHASAVRSPSCGFDAFFDDHIGVDMCGGANCMFMDDDDLDPEALYVDDLLARLDDGAGDQTYRVWKQIYLNWGWLYNIYVVEPNGQSLQINGFLKHPPSDTPQWNQSLCGQGSCADWGFQDVQ